MKWKKWLIRSGVVIVGLIVFAAVYLELNKDRLITIITDEINKNITGTFTHEGGRISILTSFPFINLSLNNVVLRDSVAFSEISPLFKAERISLCIDLRTVLANKDNIQIKEIRSYHPSIYLWEGRNGQNNYSIVKSHEDEELSNAISFDIKYFDLTDLDLTFQNDSLQYQVSLIQYNINGDLAYRNETISVINRINGGLAYESPLLGSISYETAGELDINTTTDGSLISLNRVNVTINDFPLFLSGELRQESDDLGYDLVINSPTNEIKQLVSLMPFVYQNEYGSLLTEGSFAFNGWVKGKTNIGYPSYDLSLKLDNGKLNYPGLPGSVEGLDLAITAFNDDAAQSFTKVDVSQLKFSMGSSRLVANGLVLNNQDRFVTDVQSDLYVDLKDVKRTLYLPDFERMEGIVQGLVQLKASSRPHNQKQRDVIIDRLELDLKSDNIVLHNAITLAATTLSSFVAQSKGTDIQLYAQNLNYQDRYKMNAQGVIFDPAHSLFLSSPLRADLNFDASMIQLVRADTMAQFTVWQIPDVEIDLEGRIDTVFYPGYDITGLTIDGHLSNGPSKFNFVLDNFSGSRLEGNTSLLNVIGYGLNGDTLRGDINIDQASIDLNRFITEESAPGLNQVSRELIPDNLDLNVQLKSTDLLYGKVDIQDASGKLVIDSSMVTFDNMARVLGGEIVLSGTFNGNDRRQTSIDLNMDLRSLLFSETAKKLDFFNVLVPVSNYLEGNYNTTLKWNSQLDERYFPILNTLTSYGVLETSNGRLKSFLPVDSVMNFLSEVSTIDAWEFAGSQNWFNIENGRVKIEETTLEKGDVKVRMSGSHSFEHELLYDLAVTLPKRQLKLDNIADFLKNKLDFSKELKLLSDDLEVQVLINLSGTPTRPKFSIKDVRLAKDGLSESIKDKALETVNKKADSIKKTVRDTIDVLKGKIDTTVTTLKDSLTNVLAREKQQLGKEGKDLLDSLRAGNIDSTVVRTGKILNEKKKAIEDLKKILGKGILKKKQKQEKG